ncbi:hypothetical protein BDA99DRAFT_562994 [Phascolomyces articulosus]|uniref:Uncharacterized protein n=1 Tax=Phascolomyces articulosus TaxID=60185 RepID=A0AAD5PAB8_9FUNG|nr:hypothetical protein BDA99DRAFT_562994 [Phascolomyces articulosus]
MIELCPTIAAVYLTGGKLYSMRYNYSMSIQIYKYGQDLVNSNEEKEILKQLRQTAQKQFDQGRVDFMTKIPYDVLSITLETLIQLKLVDYHQGKIFLVKTSLCQGRIYRSPCRTPLYNLVKDQEAVQEILMQMKNKYTKLNTLHIEGLPSN